MQISKLSVTEIEGSSWPLVLIGFPWYRSLRSGYIEKQRHPRARESDTNFGATFQYERGRRTQYCQSIDRQDSRCIKCYPIKHYSGEESAKWCTSNVFMNSYFENNTVQYNINTVIISSHENESREKPWGNTLQEFITVMSHCLFMINQELLKHC